MEKNKNGKGLIVVIICLVLLVLGLSGYIVYDKVLVKEKTSVKEPVKKVKKSKESLKENLDDVAAILINKLDKYDVDFYDYKGNVVFASLSDNDKLLGAYIYNGNINSLSKAAVDEYYYNLFGVKLTNYPDLNCWANDGVIFKYNASKGDYEMQTDGHGHGGISSVHSVIMKYNNIEKVGDSYIITVNKVYEPNQSINSPTPENAFYADSMYTVKIDALSQFARFDNNGNEIKADLDGAKNYYVQNYEQFKNITPQYKYTFTKNGDNYILEKFETIV